MLMTRRVLASLMVALLAVVVAARAADQGERDNGTLVLPISPLSRLWGDADACGNPSASRAVGTILAGHSFEVPTHRVVDARGRPSPAFGGGPGAQLERLAAEGVPAEGGRVDLTARRWRPS